jgi:type IV pilus assembly protein PilY1
MSVTTDFGSGVVTRKFYSAYFVLDITNPDAAGGPKLLWSFTDPSLGLTTSYPTVVRVKPPCSAANCKAELTDAKWFAIFGSGPTSYAITDESNGVKQGSKLFAIDILAGPGAANVGVTSLSVSAATNSSWKAFMGDLATVDLDLDYRVDTAYAGSLIYDDEKDDDRLWRGAMYRLTTSCPGTSCSPATWGITSGSGRVPTAVIETFGSTKLGPVTSAPTITKDDGNKLWLFFGTGRFYSQLDKSNTEQQHFFGVKDGLFSGGCVSESGCTKNLDLVDVTNVLVCSQCSGNQVTGVGGVTTLLGTNSSTTLQGLVNSKDGWFTKLTLPSTSSPRERVLASPTLLGGMVFFPTFVPVNDICTAVGDGYLYALFYLTGSAYKESVIGTDTAGGNTTVKRSISVGQGQVAQLGVHIGAQGTGSGGTNSSGGCQGGTAVIGQSSTGAITSACAKTQSAWSRYLSWSDQRL